MLSTTLDRIIDQISRPIVPIFTCKLKQMHSQEEREQRFTNPRGIERAQPLNLEKANETAKESRPASRFKSGIFGNGARANN